MKPEQRFFAHHVKPALKRAHVQRIESMVGRGIPDLNVCYKGKEFWIELKVYTNHKVYMRTQQIAWGMARSMAGGHVFVVAREVNQVHIWKHPDISGIAVPKYLIIQNAPIKTIPLPRLKDTLLWSLCDLLG